MKVLLILMLGVLLQGCTAVKKMGCGQSSMVAMYASNSLAEVMECEDISMMMDDMKMKIDEALGCGKDAAMGETICKIVVEQAIGLIPDSQYSKYKCKLKSVALKVKPLADKACAMIK